MSRPLKTGAAAVLMAAGLALIDLSLALIPLALYLLLFLVAPFVHRLGFFFPVISRGHCRRNVVALTFDDGPDPRTTPALLQLLAQHGIQATFFVIGQRAQRHPELIRAILDGGHTIGNHGFHHDTLVAFKGVKQAGREISATQQLLTGMGVTPRVFRPPVGITYPAMGRALTQLGMTAVTFNRQAWDRGNRAIAHVSRRILERVKPDDIIMLHDSLPVQRDDHICLEKWIAQIAAIVAGLAAKGIAIRPLAELIGRPIDERPASGRHTA